MIENGSFSSMIIFGSEFSHADMADKMNRNVLSAGFISMGLDPNTNNPSVQAYGESTSLKVKADEVRDTKLAKRIFAVDD